MSFLKKFGKIALTGVQIAFGVAPVLQQNIPSASGQITNVVTELGVIAGIIQSVEAVGAALSLSGPDKLKAAAPLVSQAILQSSLLTGKKIADPVLFQEGCTKIADGVVAVLNSLRESDLKVEDKKG